MHATLDKFGRIVIPKTIRNDLGLTAGAVVDIEEGQNFIILKPLEDEPHLKEKEGVLIFSGKAQGDLLKAVQQHRNDRLTRLSG